MGGLYGALASASCSVRSSNCPFHVAPRLDQESVIKIHCKPGRKGQGVPKCWSGRVNRWWAPFPRGSVTISPLEIARFAHDSTLLLEARVVFL